MSFIGTRPRPTTAAFPAYIAQRERREFHVFLLKTAHDASTGGREASSQILKKRKLLHLMHKNPLPIAKKNQPMCSVFCPKQSSRSNHPPGPRGGPRAAQGRLPARPAWDPRSDHNTHTKHTLVTHPTPPRPPSRACERHCGRSSGLRLAAAPSSSFRWETVSIRTAIQEQSTNDKTW